MLHKLEYAFQFGDSLVTLINFHFQIIHSGIARRIVYVNFQLLLFFQ